MPAGAIAAIIIVAVIAIVVALAMSTVTRRRKLRQRFGSEYDRLVADTGSARKAREELDNRERHVRSLEIRPLSAGIHESYTMSWPDLQESFVDQPDAAVASAERLVTNLIADRGFPADSYEQILGDLSVDHASCAQHYRSARELSRTADNGAASTEHLRQAMIHYRAMFGELIGEPANALSAIDKPDSAKPAGDHGDGVATEIPSGQVRNR